MASLTYGEVNETVLQAMRRPGRLYFAVVGLLGLGALAWLCVWIYQVRTGMGVTGLNHPVGWAVYIGSFVFWIGIAHSGTLISAILYLMRSKWRASVSRSAEAMTIFAIVTAGLFPLVHLGRLWVFYYILPYPNQRQIWPNFISPLVWDVLAVSTYFTVSLIFFYVGLIPDLAAARERSARRRGTTHWRTRMYRALALGWSNASSQWRHYGRSYLYFAALATPLVVSVHSVVSWDFAMGLLPGWHSTIFPPYFVAGAIHSGLAMVLTLMIPGRKLLGLERVVTKEDIGYVAQVAVVTTLIMAYSYICEPGIAWYSGDKFERQFLDWRATGQFGWIYWLILPLNAMFPLAYIFRWVRQRMWLLLAISITTNIGMWLERFLIVAGSTAHDFLPHNWGWYAPTWVEYTVLGGSFCFFLMLFFLFSKTFPPVAAVDVKEQVGESRTEKVEVQPCGRHITAPGDIRPAVMAVFDEPDKLLRAAQEVCRADFTLIEAFSPFKMPKLNEMFDRPRSPVRAWTLAGALFGLASGFGLAIYAATVNDLIVGAKHPVALIPYCIPGFEFTILFGSLANLVALAWYTRLYRFHTMPYYDPRFSAYRFGLVVACGPGRLAELQALMAALPAEQTRVID